MAWWGWLILGFGILAVEVFTATFVLLWFGIGALLVAVWAAVDLLSLGWQVGLWAILSLLMTVIWFRFYKKDKHITHVGRASYEVLGEIGIVVSPIEPFQAGRVRFQRPILGSEEWECRADVNLNRSERVKIISVEGSYLKVAMASGVASTGQQ